MGLCASSSGADSKSSEKPAPLPLRQASGGSARPLSLTRRKSTGTGHQGNLVVDGFLKYVTGASGWKTVKHTRNKALQLEAYPEDEPLGSWRGSYTVETATYEDVLSYLKDKLGPDQFELLYDDDAAMVFREYFNFAQFEKKGAFVPKVAGDHRGEAAERMSELRRPSLSKGRQSALKQKSSSLIPMPEEDGREEAADDAAAFEDEEDDDDEGDDDKKSLRKLQRLSQQGASYHTGETSTVADGEADGNNEGEDVPEPMLALNDARKSELTWKERLFGNQSRSQRFSTKTDQKSYPAEREIVFQRTEFGIGENKYVIICETVRHKERKPGTARATMRMMGALVEDLTDEKKKKNRVRVTFVASFDPELTPNEAAIAHEDALSAFGGKDRVLNFLDTLREFFSSEVSMLIQRFRNIAAGGIGEQGWEEVKRSNNELQLGTNVQHPSSGHGIVQSFDMKGRVRVVFDSGETKDFADEEKDNLRVSVQIGTRVSHPTRGTGTVKQFDDKGRVHVKFDNGEYHRYKQAAWKKKMHTYKLMGIGGALGTVKLSWRPFEGVREGMGRVRFAVGVSTADVLEYVLDYKEDAKSGNIIERKVLEKISDNQRVIYEHRNMPAPLTPRDFIFTEIWKEVAPHTFAIVMESVDRPEIPEKPGCVRGKLYMSGWLIEPLYLSEEAYDGDDHIAKITFQICMDPRGFVAPDAVAAVRQAQLLGTLTDVRAFFWKSSQAKKDAKIASSNRKSKRSSFAPGSGFEVAGGGSENLSNRISRRMLGSKTGTLD